MNGVSGGGSEEILLSYESSRVFTPLTTSQPKPLEMVGYPQFEPVRPFDTTVPYIVHEFLSVLYPEGILLVEGLHGDAM